MRKCDSTFSAINRDGLISLQVPLPPMEEQKRIAAKLQEFMQEVELAQTACEKQFEAINALPQVILRKAFKRGIIKRRYVRYINIPLTEYLT